METKVRTLAREILNGIQNADTSQNVIKWLSAARCLTVTTIDGQENSLPSFLQEYSDVPLPQLQSLFRDFHYGALCSTLLGLLSVEWVQKLPGQLFSEHVESLFLEGPAADAFLALDHAVQTHRKGFKLHKTTALLESFISKDRLLELMWDQCQACVHAAGNGASVHNALWQELILALTSLPTRMSNAMGKENGDLFLPQSYVPHLARCTLQCLQRTHARLADSKDCSLEFISRLLGKLCFTGSADLLLDVLVPVLSERVSEDFLWCRICQRVLTAVPPLTVESVIVPLLCKIHWYQLVGKFLGDCVLHNPKIRFLLTTKLLFHRYFSQVLLLQNLIGYLASSQSRHHLYIEVLERLVQVWGDASSLRHVSSEQHVFLCRAILVCLSHATAPDQHTHGKGLIELLLPAVQSHLSSADVGVRSRGMLVARCLTQKMDPSGEPINFEVPRTPEIEDLEKLLIVPPDPGLDHIHQAVRDLNLCEAEELKESLEPAAEPEEDLDSDDDLVPYDVSFDKKVSKVKAPKYIRDCMEGLLSSENVDKFEASFLAAEGLIRSRPDGLTEIAAEFAKILLHCTESCGIAGFVNQRHKTLVALTVLCPREVAVYLTSQFYEPNYNISQRLDILEVLSDAAQELSQPESQKPVDKHVKPQSLLAAPRSEVETWREVVQRRIESKTRRFGKGRTQPEPLATPNRFGEVAGEFFFPLMRFVDRGDRYLDLLGDDSLVLQRLVYCLSIVLHAAVNTPIVRQMGKILLEFTWSLRLHPNVSVRQAVLVATSIVLLTVPSHTLLTELQVELAETKAWLESVAAREVHEDCRKLAAQGLTLLETLIAKEMQSAAGLS